MKPISIPRIVVPINPEPASLMAVEMAGRIASRTGSDVEVVLVWEPGSEGRVEDRIGEARARLADVGVASIVHRLDGDVVATITEAARDAHLIVLRNHTKVKSSDTRVSVAPTTLGVIRAAVCPTLVVTERVTDLAFPVLTYNGSAQSRAAVRWALHNLAPVLFAEATAIVVTSDEHMADRLITEVQGMAAERGGHIEGYWSPGKPSEVVCDWIDTTHPETDLIVMGAFGRSWLRERVFGSTTSQILHLSTAPVLLVS